MKMIVRPAWLAQRHEDVIDPQRILVDPHHHFFAKSTEYPHYGLDDLLLDTNGHRVEQTVYVECREGYHELGPANLQVVGETEWVDGLAAEARREARRPQIGAIVGAAELRLGSAVFQVLEAHRRASPLFRGVRQIAAWEPSGAAFSMPGVTDGDLYSNASFRAGFKVLSAMELVFDAYHYHHQTPSLVKLARAFPQTQIVLDHLGTPLGVGPYAAHRDDVYAQWARDLEVLATCPNVAVKLGGLTVPWTGFAFEQRREPPSSDELVHVQERYYHHAIEQFGPDRCMFESNFPVEKCSVSYVVLWNAFKKIAARYTDGERDALCRGTATRVYRLTNLLEPGASPVSRSNNSPSGHTARAAGVVT